MKWVALSFGFFIIIILFVIGLEVEEMGVWILECLEGKCRPICRFFFCDFAGNT